MAESVRFPRGIKPANALGRPEVIAFWDGSMQAFATTIYIRCAGPAYLRVCSHAVQLPPYCTVPADVSIIKYFHLNKSVELDYLLLHYRRWKPLNRKLTNCYFLTRLKRKMMIAMKFHCVVQFAKTKEEKFYTMFNALQLGDLSKTEDDQ